MVNTHPLGVHKYTKKNAEHLILKAWAHILNNDHFTTLPPAQKIYRAHAEFFNAFSLRDMFYHEYPEPSAADKSTIDFKIPTLTLLDYVSDVPAEKVPSAQVASISKPHIAAPQVAVTGPVTSLAKKSNGISGVAAPRKTFNDVPIKKERSSSNFSSDSEEDITGDDDGGLFVPQDLKAEKRRRNTEDSISREATGKSVPSPVALRNTQQDTLGSAHRDKRAKTSSRPGFSLSPHLSLRQPPPRQDQGSPLAALKQKAEQVPPPHQLPPRPAPPEQSQPLHSAPLKRKTDDDLPARITRSWPTYTNWTFRHNPMHSIGYVEYPRRFEREIHRTRDDITRRFGVRHIGFENLRAGSTVGKIWISGPDDSAYAVEKEYEHILEHFMRGGRW